MVAGAGNDAVYGGSGADQMEGDAGDDHLDGGADKDTAVFTGNKTDYTVSFDGVQTVVTSAAEGADTLLNVEQIQFKDGLFALSNGVLTAVDTGTPVLSNTPGVVAISGVAMAGKTLTAIVVDPDGMTAASSTMTYQWSTSADGGLTWTNTAVTSKTFSLGEADVGLQLKGSASYTDDRGTTEAPTSSSVTVALASTQIVIHPMVITAPAGATVMDPLTTLIQNAADLGYTASEATLIIKSVLGIDPSINLATYDALALLTDNPGDPTALTFLKLAAQVAMTASVSDPSGMNLILAVLNAADQSMTLNLTNAADLTSAGVDMLSLSLVQGLNQDMADAGNFNTVQLVWNDWAGQKDNLKPFLGHIDAISIHINQAPTGFASTELLTQAGTDLVFTPADLVAGFTDPDGGTLNATGLTLDQGGVITDNGDGTWTFTPAAGFSGPVELSYLVDDGQGAAVPASLMLIVAAGITLPVNSAPVLTDAQAVLANGTEDTAHTISVSDLLVGFTDADGDTLSVANLSTSNGTVFDNGDGTLSIVPTANFNGNVTLNYDVTDGNGGTASTTLDYTLAAVNDAPTGGVTLSGSAKQGQTLTAGNSLADADGLGTLVYQWLANGVAINGATGNAYTLTSAEVGKTITVQASYLDGGSTQESVTSTATTAVLGITNLTLTGTSKGDTLTGAEGNDTLSGLGGSDTLSGLTGNDILNGGAGTDKLLGGDGSDLYIVGLASDHSAAEFSDTGSTGRDEVRFSAIKASTLTLYAGDTGIEQVVLGTGTGATANTNGTVALNVNTSAVKNGLTLIGNAGANSLTGTAYNDTLDGGSGIDKLQGGGGNDTYTVDLTASGTLQDTITDSGTDTGDTLVLRGASTNTTAATLTLASSLEHLDASGTGSSLLNLSGNASANTLTGNAANNVINGLGGNDILFGGLGADTLDGGTGSDLFVYNSVNQSNRASSDILSGVDFGGLDATTGVDHLRFDGLTLTGASVLNVSSTQISTQQALETTVNGDVMHLSEAVLVHVQNGVAAGTNFLLVDANGIAGYQAAGDYAIQLIGVTNLSGFDLSDLMG